MTRVTFKAFMCFFVKESDLFRKLLSVNCDLLTDQISELNSADERLTYNPIYFSSVQDFFPVRHFASFPESHGSNEVFLCEEVFKQQVEEPHAVLTRLLMNAGQFIRRQEESGTRKQLLLSRTRRAVNLHTGLLVEPENPRDDRLEIP